MEFSELGTPLSTEYYIASAAGGSYGLACTPPRFRLPFLRSRLAIGETAILLHRPLFLFFYLVFASILVRPRLSYMYASALCDPQTTRPRLHRLGRVFSAVTLLHPPCVLPRPHVQNIAGLFLTGCAAANFRPTGSLSSSLPHHLPHHLHRESF